jgi:NAD(P)-dependent dehydrogenase (short-subunit alcohol dehydrogenase family)
MVRLMNAVITGSSRGIGLELCRQLGTNESYQQIYALCRTPHEDLVALAESNKKIVLVENIDICKDDVGTALQQYFRSSEADPTPIDLLVHNAGAYGPPEGTTPAAYSSQSLSNITPEKMTYTLQLNALGPLFITMALLPNLLAGERPPDEFRRVIVISSLLGSTSNNTSGGHYAYRTAKAAVNMIGKSLSIDLVKDRIAVGLVHPGYVFTGFNADNIRREGMHDVEESVRGVLQAVDMTSMANTGCFLHGNYGDGVLPLQW